MTRKEKLEVFNAFKKDYEGTTVFRHGKVYVVEDTYLLGSTIRVNMYQTLNKAAEKSAPDYIGGLHVDYVAF